MAVLPEAAVAEAAVAAGRSDFQKAVRAIVFHKNKLLVMNRNKYGNCYRTLIGGGVESGETLEQAVIRELLEETSVSVRNPRLVFLEKSDEYHVIQHIFVCEYVNGTPRVDEASEEYLDNLRGENVYEPGWLSLAQIRHDFEQVPFITGRLLDELESGQKNNYSGPVKEWTV